MVLADTVGEHVEHVQLLAVNDEDLETTRVERHAARILAHTHLVRHEELTVVVVPEHDARGGAGHNHLLAQASVHSNDGLVMEGADNVLTASFINALLLQIHLEQLVVPVDINERILLFVDHHADDIGRRNRDLAESLTLRVVDRGDVAVEDFLVLTLLKLPDSATFAAKEKSVIVRDY